MTRYILRLDDACPTMDHDKWNLLQDLLSKYNVKPIVAVIPNNKDATLEIDNYDDSFWNKVRYWESIGWTIAMHGNTHLMSYTDKNNLILPFYSRSEFSGMNIKSQSAVIRQSWRKFKRESISPTIWVAPAHCFDQVTIEAIKAETPINIISDGIATDVYYENGFYWLPQQLWSFKKKYFGLWTVCLHPNTMNIESLRDLEYKIVKYRKNIISFDEVVLGKKTKTFVGKLHHFLFWMRRKEIKFACSAYRK